MFLFAADSFSLLPKRLAGIDKSHRNIQLVEDRSCTLIWTDDGFTECERRGNIVSLRLRRPGLDAKPVLLLEWNLSSSTVSCRRRWSGEFMAWYRLEPLLITSHLKLAAYLVRDFDLRWKRLEPEHRLSTQLRDRAGNSEMLLNDEFAFNSEASRWSYRELTRAVRKEMLRSVRSYSGDIAILFSGGLDSSILAASAVRAGKRVTAYSLSLPNLLRPSQAQCDLTAARRASAELGIPLHEVPLTAKRIIADTPSGVYLAETSRGTFVDDTPLLIAAARKLHRAGVSCVWMGEGADDLFGGFKFAFRFYQGNDLMRYFQHQLRFDLPNELAMIQNIFGAWGISVAQPFWRRELLDIGYALPLEFRVDSRRVMKQVLRDAFAGDLPSWIVQRPKIATRDGTGARNVLAEVYGTTPSRYRQLFRRVLTWRSRCPKELVLMLKT